MTSVGARGAELDAAGPEESAALTIDDTSTVNAFEGLDMDRCGVWYDGCSAGLVDLPTELFTRKLRSALISAHRSWTPKNIPDHQKR